MVILQNGVEHLARFSLRPLYRGGIPVPGMVDCPVRAGDAPRESPHSAAPCASRVPEGQPGQAFAALFAGTGIDVATTPDIVTTLWRKLCGNAPGIISAIVLKPTERMHDDAIAEAARAIVRECVAVGRAEGAKLGDEVPDAVVKSARAALRDSINSLQADRIAGRPMEVDARNGAIVRAGRKHGIPTLCNQPGHGALRSRRSGGRRAEAGGMGKIGKPAPAAARRSPAGHSRMGLALVFSALTVLAYLPEPP